MERVHSNGNNEPGHFVKTLGWMKFPWLTYIAMMACSFGAMKLMLFVIRSQDRPIGLGDAGWLFVAFFAGCGPFLFGLYKARLRRAHAKSQG